MKTIDKILFGIGLMMIIAGAKITADAGRDRDPMSFISGCIIGGLGIRYAIKQINYDKENTNYQI